jgi:hypothetical protein
MAVVEEYRIDWLAKASQNLIHEKELLLNYSYSQLFD